jgi:putative ABC transport system permease protein
MFDLDKWEEILNTITKHPLRTILTAFGVFWGILMLVLLLAAGKGLENGVNSNFKAMAKNTLWVWTGKTTIPYDGLKSGRRIYYTNDDYEQLKLQIPEIKYIAPGTSIRSTYTINYEDKTGSFTVGGDYPDLQYIRSIAIPSGRFITHSDIEERRKIAVLGSRVVEVLFGKENPIGKYIQIKGVYFQVVGTFLTETLGGPGRDDSEKIFIPLTTLQESFNQPNMISSFGIVPHEDANHEQMEVKVKALLSARHHVSPEDKNAIGSINTGKEAEKVSGLFWGINAFIWGVSIMTIIAGVVGVSNIMLIIVKERTKEIGIRKALGATPGSIVSQILTESIVITSLSGYLGLLAGVAITEWANSMLLSSPQKNSYFSNPQVDLNVALLATLLMVVAGAIAGLIPAIKASRISPIEALRAE